MSERFAIVAAGGTGGHMFPAQALSQELARRGWRVALVTDQRGERYAADFPCDDKRLIDAATFAGQGPLGRIKAVFSILRGVSASRSYMRKTQPDAVIGFGGYPSLPTMAAAALERRPRMIHEQNAVLGRVNRRLAPHMTRIATAFPEVKGVTEALQGRSAYVGNPVRDQVRALSSSPFAAPEADGPIRLLIFGGSQGARIFSKILPQAVASSSPSLLARLVITQQAREEDLETVRETYAEAGVQAELAPFFSDMPERIRNAHLVIARAGASTVTELAVIGRPAIFSPLAIAMDDHQTANAQAFIAAGGGMSIPEAEFTAERVSKELTELAEDPERLCDMARNAGEMGRADAAGDLADLVEGIAPVRQERAA